jgi:Protein of unknown function (DUF2892)
MGFIKFMSSTAGRWLRGVLGLALAAWGFTSGGAMVVLGVLGVVVFAAGLFDFCIFGPIFGGSFSGKKNRSR